MSAVLVMMAAVGTLISIPLPDAYSSVKIAGFEKNVVLGEGFGPGNLVLMLLALFCLVCPVLAFVTRTPRLPVVAVAPAAPILINYLPYVFEDHSATGDFHFAVGTYLVLAGAVITIVAALLALAKPKAAPAGYGGPPAPPYPYQAPRA